MTFKLNGREFGYTEDLVEKFGYSDFHIRHLARLYEHDTIKGLKGRKYKGRWAFDMEDASRRLGFDGEDNVERLDTDDSGCADLDGFDLFDEESPEYSSIEGL